VTALAERSTMPSPDPSTIDIDIVVPVFNEESDLAASVHRLDAYLTAHVPFCSTITIADNASTDGTWQVATALASGITRVRAVHLDAKGRGRALQHAWSASAARVVAYMDVDLSTDLNALLPLVAPLLSGHSDVAIGSRLARTSRVVRGRRRELISRGYNLILRSALRTRFSDAQCGFKALTSEAAQALLPHVRDTAWFFDTELLVLAERSGLRIAEVPVDWVDDPDSRVDIVPTALADLRGVARLGRALMRGDLPLRQLGSQLGRRSQATESLLRQAIRFTVVGVASTLGYLGLFLSCRGTMGVQAANLLALLVTAVLNTAANRRFTFGVSGIGFVRQQLQGLLVFAVGLGLTSGSLAVLDLISTDPPRVVEVVVLVAVNLASTVLRFVLLREWVFATRKVTR
jgi:putative flippase GtrA